MKPEKAIKLIEFLFVRRPKLIDEEYDAAIKLGGEALKIVLELRRRFPKTCYGLMPGETEE